MRLQETNRNDSSLISPQNVCQSFDIQRGNKTAYFLFLFPLLLFYTEIHLQYKKQKQSNLLCFVKHNIMEGNNISMVVLPESAWNNITSEIASLKSILQKKSEEEVNGQWVESSEARRLLGVSQKTWQTYRDSRKIPFSQFGRKIYVKRADLESFLQNHYVSSK